MTPCEYCQAKHPDRFTVTYNLANFCCVVRYCRNTPALKREATILMFGQKHGEAAIRAALDQR